MVVRFWMMPAGIGLCTVIAISSALPQISGLAQISVHPPVSAKLRIIAQSILFLPLIITAISGFGLRRWIVLPTAIAAIAYAWLPAPFFDYVWDVFLIESLFLLACSEAVSRPLGIWLFRLLLFKLMFSMGVVKFLHGMPEWRDGTALKYFWQNQPMPGYLAWYFAQCAETLQRLMVLFVFLVEIPGPFLIFIGPRARRIYFFMNLLLQIGIFIAGNYGFFNILTLAVSFSLWDIPQLQRKESYNIPFPKVFGYARLAAAICIAGWLATSFWYVYKCLIPGDKYLHETSWIFLSNEEQKGMSSPVRGLIAFYASAKVSNPYALFGMIPKYRLELGLEGSADGTEWKKYSFRVRPELPNVPPLWYAPHHWRLDHQMYYESFRIREPMLHERYSYFLGVRWVPQFIEELLAGKRDLSSLFAVNPFAAAPPLFLRFTYQYYEFTRNQEFRDTGNYWKIIPAREGKFNEKQFNIRNLEQLP